MGLRRWLLARRSLLTAWLPPESEATRKVPTYTLTLTLTHGFYFIPPNLFCELSLSLTSALHFGFASIIPRSQHIPGDLSLFDSLFFLRTHLPLCSTSLHFHECKLVRRRRWRDIGGELCRSSHNSAAFLRETPSASFEGKGWRGGEGEGFK